MPHKAKVKLNHNNVPAKLRYFGPTNSIHRINSSAVPIESPINTLKKMKTSTRFTNELMNPTTIIIVQVGYKTFFLPYLWKNEKILISWRTSSFCKLVGAFRVIHFCHQPMANSYCWDDMLFIFLWKLTVIIFF